MEVKCLGNQIEVPDYLVDKYVKDFDTLPGSGNREAVLQLRDNVYDVIDYIAEEPEALEDYEYRSDFINALAVHRALQIHGLLHDS